MPHTLIVGRSGCGKTHYLLKFLKVLETHDVNRAIKEILGRRKKGRALIIFDDVATSKDVKYQTSELVKLGFSGRHHGIDTIVLTQQLTSIAKAYREN